MVTTPTRGLQPTPDALLCYFFRVLTFEHLEEILLADFLSLGDLSSYQSLLYSPEARSVEKASSFYEGFREITYLQ